MKQFSEASPLVRSVNVFLSVVSLLAILVSARAYANPNDPHAPATFGTYHESNLDLEVKVRNGYIRIWRVWQGDHRRWVFNVHQADLSLKDSTEDPNYQRLVAREISRGPRKFSRQLSSSSMFARFDGPTVPREEDKAFQFNGSIFGLDQGLRAIVQSFIDANGITLCGPKQPIGGEGLFVTQFGYRLTDGTNRDWAEFDTEGLFTSWGNGNDMIGSREAGPGNQHTYRDADGRVVISPIRDKQGRLAGFRDYTGREVRYEHVSDYLSTDTPSPGYFFINTVRFSDDSEVQHYTFEFREPENAATNFGAYIVSKRVGLPGLSADEGYTETISYNPDGTVKSVLDEDGYGSTYIRDYKKKEKLFIETEKLPGNRVIKRYQTADGSYTRIELNDQPHFRTEDFCEDSVIADEHNRITYFDRDPYERLINVYFPDGKKISFEHSVEFWPNIEKPWNAEGKPWGMIKYTDSGGTEVNYLRNWQGRLVEADQKGPDGTRLKWKFGYDEKGQKIEQRLIVGDTPNDETDFVDRYSYDENGNVIAYTNARHITWRYAYNSRGLLTKIEGPNRAEWRFAYTSRGRLKSSLTPSGYREEYDYTARGLVKEHREYYAEGKVARTQYRYNRRGQLVTLIDPFEREWTYEYDEGGDLVREKDPEGGEASYTYDRKGRVVSETDERGIETKYEYYDTALPGEQPTGLPFGPIVKVIHPTFTEELGYNFRDQLTFHKVTANSGEERITRYTYNDRGQIASVTTPDLKQIRYTYDGLGRPLTVTSASVGTTTYQYTESGKRTVFKDPLGKEYIQEFNNAGELMRETRADNTTVSYAYDLFGNVDQIVDSNGKIAVFEYDNASRVREVRLYAQFPLADPVKTITYRYNLRGDVIEVSDGAITKSYEVDELGRTVSSTTNYGPFEKSHAYTYSTAGLLETYRASDNTTYRYQWEGNGAPKVVEADGVGAFTYRYGEKDAYRPEAIVFPGGTVQSFQYDDL